MTSYCLVLALFSLQYRHDSFYAEDCNEFSCNIVKYYNSAILRFPSTNVSQKYCHVFCCPSVLLEFRLNSRAMNSPKIFMSTCTRNGPKRWPLPTMQKIADHQNSDPRSKCSRRYTCSCASAANLFIFLLIDALTTTNDIASEMREWYKRSLEENRSYEWLILKVAS
jgi:hypothetical protein